MRDYGYCVVGEEEERSSLSFVLDCLLKSRIETGEETRDDEDVNVYLAGLLHSFLDSSFFFENGPFLSRYGDDVFSQAEESGDLRTRYRVYKGNADFALMSLGIFGGLPRGRGRGGKERGVADRGRIYYQVASDTRVHLRRKPGGVAAVLSKLSDRFDTYARILSHLRCRHFHLIPRLSRGEVYHLQRQAQTGATPVLMEHGLDRFLDAYWNWMQSGDERDRETVNRLGQQLNRLDRRFRFNGV